MEHLDPKLTIIHTLPDGFLTIDPRDLMTLMPNPTIIDLKSTHDKPPLFVSILLHGNETTGFYALQHLLSDYLSGDKTLPRDLIILVGNVYAAKLFQRRLVGQVDYNRIWAGGSRPEHLIANQVLNYLRARKPFAGIDIHNNTGSNPFYSCVNTLGFDSLHLAKLFSNLVVYFTRPHQTLSVALNQFTTAITIESGRSGKVAGIERVYQFVEEVLNLPQLETSRLTNNDVAMFHSIARIYVPNEATITFDKLPQSSYGFTFIENIESMNFLELSENTCIGWRHQVDLKLQVINEQGEDVSDDMFHYDNGEIRVKRPIVPAMFCTSETIIRQDCFGYIMQRYSID
jgi:hypothetical protein